MFSSPKGTHDLLPDELSTWRYVERTAEDLFESAGFREIRTPVLESTELFERGVGENTDIVNKEMYTFEKGGRNLTLRPENTAGVVRAYIQHGMDRWPKPVKLFYKGPMFRYERPQAGRQRQFHQMGAELFGLDTPQSDAAVILLAFELFTRLEVPGLSLEMNNVGCFTCRQELKERLKSVLAQHFDTLCPDCRRRYHTNPLRLLDCKNPGCRTLFDFSEVPALLELENTCQECQDHFQSLLAILEQLGIPFHHNRMLVRGLDYYTRTVFEITSAGLGSQNAVCGGGRYNGLVKELGGPDTPAVGWALGMERLISLIKPVPSKPLDFYIASDDSAKALLLARTIQQRGFSADVDLSTRSLGKQIAQAGRLNAAHVVILGEAERMENRISLKNMQTGVQQSLTEADFLGRLNPFSPLPLS